MSRRALLLSASLIVVAGTALAGAQATSPAPPDRAAIIAAARDIIGKARYATFITLDGKGHPQARMVDPFAPDEDLTIWVATNARTRKAAQIAYDNRVTMLYFDAVRESYVTVIGRARLVRDPGEKAKHWKEEWKAFYKGGYGGDEFLLIRVAPERLEVVSTVLGMKSDPQTWRPVILDLR